MKTSSVSLPAARADLPTSFVRFLRRRSAWIAVPAVTCLAIGPMATSAMAEEWDPAVSAGTALGGAGVWNTSTANWWDGVADVVWPNTATSAAVFGGAAGGAVAITTGSGVTANSLVFSTTGYTLTGSVAADVLNLAGVTPGIMVVNPADTATINAIITGTSGLSKSGLGTLALGGVNTFTGGVSITGGILNATNIAALGANDTSVSGGGKLQVSTGTGTWGTNVALDGGTFGANLTGTISLAVGKTIALGAGGGGIEVGPTGGSTSKILLAASQLTGSGTLTKSGIGVLQLSGANAGFSGPVTINSGTIEFQNADSLGTAATTITVNNGGDIATSGTNNRNNITLNAGGIISANNAAANYTGTVNVAGNATAALRLFQTTTTANSFAISGPITGSGNLTATAPAAATLTLTGSRAGHTGQVVAGTNATVLYSNASTINTTSGLGLAGGTAQIRSVNALSPTLGTAGLTATYYNFGSNPNATTNPQQYAVDQLYLNPRTFTRTDFNINIPQAGAQGDWPIVPVAGFAIGAATPAGGQNDGVMWKGLINITNAGSYQFSGQNDDNLVLIIDGVTVGTLGVLSANTNIGSAVSLSAGAHSIVVKHSQGGGGGYATLSYNGGAGSDAPTTVLIPNSKLSTGSLAALDIGPITSAGGTLDIVGPTTSASMTLGNGTLSLTSSTVDNLTVGGGLINGATPTLAPTSAGLIVTGPIGQDIAGRGLNFAGPYFGEFQGANTYDGLTTVTGGQLRLNTTGANSIAGSLTVNAANGLGAVNNVVLKQSNQIADSATLTMTAGILDIGSNSDTVASLNMNGGVISGTNGVLTVTNPVALTGGSISASLAGTAGVNKTGTGLAVLSGNNSYTGVTAITAGTLQAQGTNALGAGGAGNETTVTSGATLRLGGLTAATENLSVGGTGIDAVEGAIRNLGGVSAIGQLTTTSAATVRVDSGELILNGPLNVGAGALTKTGNGILTFATNQATIPAVTHTAGAIGFSGTQSFGAATVPAGLAYSFNSNPGGGVSITAGPTSTIIANYNADQSFLSAINTASTGTLALTGTATNNLNFSAAANVSLGGRGFAYYTGTITPNAGGYRLGGGGGKLTVESVLSGSAPLQINGEVQLNATNTFTGATTIKSGGKLFYVNDQALGAANNGLTLDGGTLFISNNTDVTGGTSGFTELGHPKTGGRIITVAAGGGTIDITSRQAQGNFGVIGVTNGLTGSGALTKTGLGFLGIFSSNNYNGALTIAPNGNRIDLRSGGALPNLASLTIESRGEFDIDNNNTLGSNRVWASVDNRNRLNDAATIQLNGGILKFVGRNVALGGNPGSSAAPATSAEYVGATTIGVGQNYINSSRTGGGGSDLVIANLIRNVGSGTVNFTTDGNTLGQFGDNPRIILTQVNGSAPTASAFIGGWATINQSDFAAYGQNATVGGVTATSTGVVNYGSTGAPTYTALTAATAPGAGGFATGNVGNAAASLALGTAGAGQNFVVRALRFGSNATAETISFAGTTGTADTLYVESGGIITDNGTGAKALGVAGTAFTRGRLTAGATTSTTPQELFFHNNTGAGLTIASQIIDNPNNAAATVKIVKAQDGTVTLDGANLFSGGTLVARGTLTVNSTGGLGTGAVVVKNSTLNLGNKGSTSSTAGVTLTDQSLLVLTNNTAGAAGAYDGAGDRFTVGSGSTIYANSPGAGFGLNSLTRVTSFTGGGQVILAPGAIVKHNLTNAPNQGSGTLTINNLGTAADLFFAPNTGAVAAYNQSITVGSGTPWAGFSSDRGNTQWNAGTIYANSDFVMQGLTRDGGVGAFILGAASGTANSQGGVQIVNTTNGPINANIFGQVIINEDEPVSLPSNMTFVLGAGSVFQPNTSMALGYGSSQAKVRILAGGTMDPGNYIQLGATANANRNEDGSIIALQNLPYALPSPVNGQVTVEAGGRFLINDASGIGSAPIGSYTLKANSILDLGSSNAFFGRGNYGLTQAGPVDTTGVANPGQFVYEPGAVVRLSANNIYKLSQFVPSNVVLEVAGGDRQITGQVNPFLIPAVGTVLNSPEDVTIGLGGMLTNDNNDRTNNELRGRLLLENGATLAATNSTYFNIQEGLNVAAGATITIGSAQSINGMPKLGAVQLTGPNSTVMGAGSSFNVVDGAQLSFGSTNVYPDTAPITLPAAVTAFPGNGGFGTQPGNGSTLLLNVANFIEYTGHVTGNGTVMANQAGTALAINATSNHSSNIVFKSTNGQNPSLMKSGNATLTLTGASDSQGFLVAQAGEVITTGTADWSEVRPQRGAKITVDSSGVAQDNRLGTPTWFVGQGGMFELKGHATTNVTENFTNIASGAGNFVNVAQNPMISTIKITPSGTATTTLQVDTFENFVSAGQRLASYIIQAPSVSNLPGTYGSATGTAYTPNVGNVLTGLLKVAQPNFASQNSNGVIFGTGVAGTILNPSGSPLVPVAPHFLADTNSDGVADGFMTTDGGIYRAGTLANTSAVVTGINTVGLTAGQRITGQNVPAGATILTIDSPTQLTLSVATAANTAGTFGLSLPNANSYMRAMAASEYAPYMRDNLNTMLNVRLTGTTNVTGDARIATLTMAPGSVLNINGTAPVNGASGRLHLNAAGLFVESGGTATINGSSGLNQSETYLQINGGAGFFVHTIGDLNLNAKVFSDLGVIKTGSGTLNVGPTAFGQFRGALQIDGGVVNLAANNSFSNIRSQNGSTSNNHIYMNAGTLNLNGNSQMINLLSSANELPGQGGTIRSTSAATILNTGGGRFAGVLDGAISFDKVGNNAMLFTSAQTYSGTTTLRANTTTLRDSATLATTGALTIKDAQLTLDNGYLSAIDDRINPASPVTLNGGTIFMNGAAGKVTSQTFNSLTLSGGSNALNANAGGSGAAVFNIGNLVRTANSGGVVNFGQGYGFVGTLGNTTTAIRYNITNVNGSPLTLNDGILGGWAVVRGTHFATYRSATGIGELSNVNDGYANYDSTDATAATATQNVNDGAARTFATSKTINSWRMTPGAAITNTYNNGVGLTIDAGALLSDANFTISHAAAADARGNFLTANGNELHYWVNQNTNGVNIPITGSLDFVKSGPGGLNLAPSSLLTATSFSTNVINTTNTVGLEVGDAISGGTTTVYPVGTVITAINPGVSITTNFAPTTVGATLDYRATFGNNYTGKTIVNQGTLTLNQVASGTAARAIPGDLYLTGGSTVVTEANVGGQINPASNITIGGGARLNFVNVAGVTESVNSITFLDGSSGTGTANVDRTGLQLTSTLDIAGANAITSGNTNPSNGVPFFGGNLGNLSFSNTGGATLNINSPTAVNGVLAVGLRIGSRISSIPTNVAGGGLIKTGNGLLTLDPDQTPVVSTSGTTVVGSNEITGMSSTAGLVPGLAISGTNIPAGAYVLSVDSGTKVTISANATVAGAVGNITAQGLNSFGSPAVLTDVLNVQSGIVRADRGGALGSNLSNTTVQSGAVLLGSNSGGLNIIGSVTLKDGSTLGATINSFTLGAATDIAANQTVLNVPSGNVHIAAYDYFVPNTNNGNITINGKLTGSGNINIYGPQLYQGNGGGGVIQLGNPILTGTGSNDYNGTITVGANSVLANQVALIPKNTTIVRTTGNAMGAATINLAGGRLRLRDDLSATVDVSNSSITYGNNVNLTADSFLDANRQSSTTATGNTINLGTLTVTGNRVLNVDSGNSYQIGFASLAGSGNLIKAGGGRLNINSIDPGFGGDIGMAGPSGVTVAPTFNTTTAQNLVLPSTANLSGNFNLNGLYITEAGKTLSIANNFNVNSNPGNVSGMLAVTNTTILQADTFVNNGQVGAAGGSATITANGFMGSGHYVTNGQALTLAGGVSAGILKVAGNNTVTVTGASITPSATEVQSGVLRIAPNSPASSSGTLRVYGSPSSIASGTTAPIAAVAGTLLLDGTSASISHTGNVTNNGLVQVSAGNATISGVISGTPVEYVPGLLEGFTTAPGGALPVDNTRVANPGNFGIRLEPRMLQTNAVTQQVITGHVDNDTWIYTGYVKDDDGVFSFAENIDDRAAVWVDGVLVLNASNGGTSRVVSTAFKDGQQGQIPSANANLGTPNQNFGAGISLPGYGTGWHLIEIRMNNGTGGSGPIAGNGFNVNYGFGYKNGIAALDGSDMTKPIDNGTGNLFVTPVGGKGTIQVDANSSLTAGGTTQTAAINLNGGSTPSTAATLKLTGAAYNSDADALNVNGGTTPQGNVNADAGHVLSVPAINVAAGGNLNVNPTGGTGEVRLVGGGSGATGNGTGAFTVAGGTFNITTTAALSNTADVFVTGGNFRVDGTATAANVTVNGTGMLSGVGTVNSTITQTGGFISPGNSPGVLTTNGNIVSSGGAFKFELNGPTPGTGYDQLVLNGNLSLTGTTVATFTSAYTPNPMTDWFYLIKSSTPITGIFAGLAEGTPVTISGQPYYATYQANSATNSSYGGNDFALIPEPGSMLMMLFASFLCFFRRRRRE